MDRLISENKVLEAIDNLKANFTCYDSVTLDEVASHVKAILSAEPCESCCNGNQEKKAMLCQKSYLAGMEHRDMWIPVSERLPEENTAVLIWCPERRNIYCAYLEEKQWWIFGAYFQKVALEVIAWMPLPPCYDTQESEEV